MKQNFEYRNAAFDILKADWKGAVLLYFAISIIPLIIGTVLGSILGNNEVLSSFSSLLLEVFVSFPLVYLFNKEILKFVRGGKIEVSKELVEPFKADYLKALEEGFYEIYIGEIELPADYNLSEFFTAEGQVNYGISEKASVNYENFKKALPIKNFLHYPTYQAI